MSSLVAVTTTGLGAATAGAASASPKAVTAQAASNEVNFSDMIVTPFLLLSRLNYWLLIPVYRMILQARFDKEVCGIGRGAPNHDEPLGDHIGRQREVVRRS